MLTFDDYKARISIIQVAEDLGYKQDLSKGKISPVYKLTDSNGNKMDEIVIKDPHTIKEHYFDRQYKGGDLIAFLKNHIDDFPQFSHQNMFVRLNKILSHYANITYVPRSESYVPANVNIQFDITRYDVKECKVEDLNYLTIGRNISPETVADFLPFIRKIRDTKSSTNFYNVAFPYCNPMQDSQKVTNFEMRNYNFKGMASGGDKSKSLWIADFSSRPTLAKNIYFAESALDAMSFYELNKNKIDFSDSVFCSIGGYICNTQISNALAKYPNAAVHTLFDNDLNGNLYDIKVHSIIGNNDVEIKEIEGKIHFKTKSGHEFTLAKSEINIENFRKNAHYCVPLSVHKTQGAKDFNEILMELKPQKKNLGV